MVQLFKNILKHGSLYSGIGGWLLAARYAGIENIFTVEIDEFCNKVLDKHFPETDRLYDIKETNFKAYKDKIDILSTSDPCQPFSFAGKRGGKADARYLWSYTIRAIQQIRPSYIVFENVPGFINLALKTTLTDLEREGYTCESFIIPACAVGAWHRRDRLWVIAYSGSESTKSIHSRRGEKIGLCMENKQLLSEGWNESTNRFRELGKDVPDPNSVGLSSQREQEGIRETEGEACSGTKRGGLLWREWITEGWEPEPNVGRVVHGVPNRVDRLKSLGNSIVPQIAYIIFEAIKQYDSKKRPKPFFMDKELINKKINRPKGFFTDREVRKFSFKEKITYIFKQLYGVLQPVETGSYERIYIEGKYKRIKKYIFDKDNTPIINSVELPFTDISVKSEKDIIEITGENFCYTFPADMMPQIWDRTKKVL